MRAVPRRHSSPALRPTVPWPHKGPPAGLGFANCRVPPEAISSTAQSPPVACRFSDGAPQAEETAAGLRSSRPAARTNPQASQAVGLLQLAELHLKTGKQPEAI